MQGECKHRKGQFLSELQTMQDQHFYHIQLRLFESYV